MEEQLDGISQSGSRDSRKFVSVTCHLKDKDFRWLKEDMGFFDLPETWDLSMNDNQRSFKT